MNHEKEITFDATNIMQFKKKTIHERMGFEFKSIKYPVLEFRDDLR